MGMLSSNYVANQTSLPACSASTLIDVATGQDFQPLDGASLHDMDGHRTGIGRMNCNPGPFEPPPANKEEMTVDPWSSDSPTNSRLPAPSPPRDGCQFVRGRNSSPTPSSPPPPLCAGCRLRIIDRYYLVAVETKWHSACLKCAECGVELENQVSCFERHGHIFCKEDYLRIFANKCFRCGHKIQPTDLVMKIRNCLFHVDCFRCATCDSSLKKGDLFGMFEDLPYCQLHYEIIGPGGAFVPDPLNHSPGIDGSGGPPPLPHPRGGMAYHPFGPPLPTLGPGGVDQPPPPPGWFVGNPGATAAGAATAGGGGGDFPYDNNNEPRLKKQRGRKKRKVETFAAMNGYLEAGGYPPGMDGPGGSKAKRARTSFKHHQLRIMKAHFQINQNPDSRELKMLSQKTQLDKKVLQVWFQNARAKWRRTKAQDVNGSGQNGMIGVGGGGGGIPPAPNSSSSGMSGPEDADMGGASPSSDCSGGAMIPCC